MSQSERTNVFIIVIQSENVLGGETIRNGRFKNESCSAYHLAVHLNRKTNFNHRYLNRLLCFPILNYTIISRPTTPTTPIPLVKFQQFCQISLKGIHGGVNGRRAKAMSNQTKRM